jgi:hypothetical protein
MIAAAKNLLAAGVIAAGLGVAGSADAQQANNNAQPDQFHPSFHTVFNVAACTNDNHTANATIITFQSINDWQTNAQSNPTGFQQAYEQKAQTILEQAWKDAVSTHSSGEYNSQAQGFINDVVDELTQAQQEIETQTGITVVIRGGISGNTTPGCS